MKKIIVISQLNEMKAQESKLKKCQVVGFRGPDANGKEVFFKNNLVAHPSDRVSFEFSELRGELVIRCKLNHGDFLALGDEEGTSEKEILESTE